MDPSPFLPNTTGPEIFQPEDAFGLQWQISSRSHPNRDGGYLVDLAAYGCRGTCQCMDWTTRVGPAVKRGEWKTCYHVRVAQERRANWSLRRDAALDPNREHDARELGT